MKDELKKRNHIDIKNLAKEIAHDNAILFIGAGMSLNAIPINDQVSTIFRDWTGFMLQLARKLWPGTNESELYWKVQGNNLYVTQLFKERFGEVLFYKEFLNAVPTEDYIPSDIHHSLFSLPWIEYLTTNQDDLIEKSLDDLKIVYQKIVNDIDITHSTKKRLMKIHGSWERPESLVFAEDDYRNYEQKHPILALRLKQIFAERTVFFIGYSLQDEDFKNLFGWVRDILGPFQKKAYAYIPNVDIYQVQYWEKRHLYLISDSFEADDPAEKKLLFQSNLQDRIKELQMEVKLEKARSNYEFDVKTNYETVKHLAISVEERGIIEKWIIEEQENIMKKLHP